MKEYPDISSEEAIFGGYRQDGLFAIGPNGMYCVLAKLIADSLLVVSGSTFDGMRRAHIRERADYLRRTYSIPELQAIEAARRQTRSGYGLYGRSVKPANSGRKRRAAA